MADFTVFFLLTLVILFCLSLNNKESVEEKVTATEIPITVVLRAQGVDEFSQSIVDIDELVGMKINSNDATIERVYYEPHVQTNIIYNGDIVADTSEIYKDLVVELSTTMMSDEIFLTLGTQEIRAGMGFFLITDTFEITTVITSVIKN